MANLEKQVKALHGGPVLPDLLPDDWKAAYEAGVYTEFMEQRAPGHTVLDDKIYRKGLADFQADIDAALSKLDYLNDPAALDKREELTAMRICCDAVTRMGRRGQPWEARHGRRRTR